MELNLGVGHLRPRELAAPSDDAALSIRPSPIWQGNALSPAELHKVRTILSICNGDQKVEDLIALSSSSSGLVDDEIRRQAWPILLGYNKDSSDESHSSTSWKALPRHKDEDQVELDVNRSFIYYPKGETDQQIDRRKRQLSDVIVQVLREHPMLCYFQGYHDIVQVFLLVLGIDRAPTAVAHLSLLRIRDFMLPSLSPSLKHLRLLPAILQMVDLKLCRHLSATQPFFALSATLTLYAHDIQEYGDIARLFDFLIAQPAVVSVYFFAIIVLSRRDELFEIPLDEPEMLHSVLSKLPKPLDLEALIARTLQIFNDHPPESLPGLTWWWVSPYSVLKTTRRPQRRVGSIHDGELLFHGLSMQLRREELRKYGISQLWKYRRPARRIGIAVLVVVVSYWVQKNGLPKFGSGRDWTVLKYAR